jgi:RNA polymerase sigma factor (TIGR02999 family)
MGTTTHPPATDPPAKSEISDLLDAWREGDVEALEGLMPLVYEELRRLAGSFLRKERRGHTLQPTALVHEAYCRLRGKSHPHWKGRVHFYSVAAQLMRRILIDHARSLHYAKRGGGALKVTLDEEILRTEQRTVEMLALDDALTALEAFDPELQRLVELRFFGGLSIEETAEVLGVSVSTVKREWRTARAWLHGELSGRGGP